MAFGFSPFIVVAANGAFMADADDVACEFGGSDPFDRVDP